MATRPQLVIFFLAAATVCFSAAAEIIDRVAVVVGQDVIKWSDIDRDIRVTDFLNEAALDFGASARKQSASRLIDQALIRQQIRSGEYPPASLDDAGRLLASLRSDRFHSDAAYHAALSRYGITEEELRDALLWQLTVLRFIEARFHPETPASDGNQRNTQVDEMLNDWLQQSRKDARIVYPDKSLQ